jgi:hypothetical protein
MQPSQTVSAYAEALRLKTESKPKRYLAKSRHEAFQTVFLGIKPQRTWQEAVVRYLEVKDELAQH